MFSLSTWIWLIERNDLVDFVPNGYDRILLALTPQRPNIDFGLFIRPFTVQAWRGIGITFAIIITCIILPYMTLRGLHYSNTDRYVLSQGQLQRWTEHSTLIFENLKPVEKSKNHFSII